MKQLTNKQKKEYVKHGYGSCPNPNCDNKTDFDGSGMEADGDWVSSRVTCNECECVFDDIYTLADVQIIEDGS